MSEGDFAGSGQICAVQAIQIERVEPLIRAREMAYAIYEKPDLDLMARFLTDFGMVEVQRDAERLFMRGMGGKPFIYAVERGEQSRFLGIGVEVDTRADLETLQGAHPGSHIEPIDGPGGGERLRLRDPNGFIVDLVHGRDSAAVLSVERGLGPTNRPGRVKRVNSPQRAPVTPTPVVRLGHVVLGVGRFHATLDWLMRNLGMIPSDVQHIEDGRPALVFLRFDRGATPTDHHSIVLLAAGQSMLLHSAFETFDVDAIGQGAQVMKRAGWRHVWGIGRHTLGSQLFDYWQDPFGQEVEHYADSDVFDSDYPTGYSPVSKEGLWAWGNDAPTDTAADEMPEEPGAVEEPAEAELHAGLRRALAAPARPWLI